MANATAQAQLTSANEEIARLQKQADIIETKLAELKQIAAALTPLVTPAAAAAAPAPQPAKGGV